MEPFAPSDTSLDSDLPTGLAEVADRLARYVRPVTGAALLSILKMQAALAIMRMQ